MENIILYLTIYAAVVTGLLITSAIIIIIQRRQLWAHEDRIRDLAGKQDLFPSQHIRLVQTGNIRENENNFKLDNNYMRAAGK